jgi:hypothetical protein
MIDVDALEDQLEQALAANLGFIPVSKPPKASPPPKPAPQPPVAPATKPFRARTGSPERPSRAQKDEKRVPPAQPARRPTRLSDYAGHITRLLAEGRLAEADVSIAAHAELAADAGPAERWDAAAWATMRALLDGRAGDARARLDEVLRPGRRAEDPTAASRHLAQRFWVVLEWGDEDEQYDLLEDCRSRAYTHGEPGWRGALTLLLAHLGRRDEAARELEATVAECEGRTADAMWLDIVSDLAEAAFLLGDGERAKTLHKWLAELPEQLVVVGPGDVCKGSLSRFQANAAAVVGAWPQADERFRVAADTHRAIGARPLLARTLHQWGRSLAGRDDLLARRCLQEGEELAEELGLRSGQGTRDTAVPTSG